MFLVTRWPIDVISKKKCLAFLPCQHFVEIHLKQTLFTGVHVYLINRIEILDILLAKKRHIVNVEFTGLVIFKFCIYCHPVNS